MNALKQKAMAIGLAILGIFLILALFKMVLASVFWMLRLALIMLACVGLGLLIRKVWK